MILICSRKTIISVHYAFKLNYIIHFVNYFNIYSAFTMSNQTLKFHMNLNPYVGQFAQTLKGTKATFIQKTQDLLNEDLCKEKMQFDTNTHDRHYRIKSLCQYSIFFRIHIITFPFSGVDSYPFLFILLCFLILNDNASLC